jgi:hypothetical protein
MRLNWRAQTDVTQTARNLNVASSKLCTLKTLLLYVGFVPVTSGEYLGFR